MNAAARDDFGLTEATIPYLWLDPVKVAFINRLCLWPYIYMWRSPVRHRWPQKSRTFGHLRSWPDSMHDSLELTAMWPSLKQIDRRPHCREGHYAKWPGKTCPDTHPNQRKTGSENRSVNLDLHKSAFFNILRHCLHKV
jgi:hypothetical protein